jgi:hypothetical protein
LFDPLGIGHVGWSTLAGREQGFSGLHARTEDIAKLGLLYLRQGQWEGTQLIPGEWVAEATSAQVSNSQNTQPDWQQGYGFQFWMSRHGYRGDGAFGQFCLILPEQDAVIVTTAYTLAMPALLDAIWDHLLPGLGSDSPDDAAQEQLDARLAGLELAACPGAPASADWGEWAGAFTITAGTAGTQAQPFLFSLEAPPFLTSIEVGQQADGWEISLIEAGNALTVPVGTGGWTVSDHVDRYGDTIPVAASGGWLDDQTLRVEVIFLETPHRMDITCSLPQRSAQAVWRHPPLTPSKLRQLHCPS